MDDASRIGANTTNAAANKTAFAKKIKDFSSYLREFYEEMNGLQDEFITVSLKTSNIEQLIAGHYQLTDLINVVLSKRMNNPTRPIDKYLKQLFLKRPWVKEYFEFKVVGRGYRGFRGSRVFQDFADLDLERFLKLSNYTEREFIKATDLQSLISAKQCERLKLYENRSRIKPVRTKLERFEAIRRAEKKAFSSAEKTAGKTAGKVIGKKLLGLLGFAATIWDIYDTLSGNDFPVGAEEGFSYERKLTDLNTPVANDKEINDAIELYRQINGHFTSKDCKIIQSYPYQSIYIKFAKDKRIQNMLP